MDYLSASPPPLKILFVYGNKVKENQFSDGLIKQDLKSTPVDRKVSSQRLF